MTRYYKINGLSTVLKMEVMPDGVHIYEWTDGKWRPTGNKYVGVFVGKIEAEEILEGDELWDPQFNKR